MSLATTSPTLVGDLTSKENIMHIGIIGAGAIGQAVATQAVRAGLRVTLSNSRGPDSLKEVVAQLGPHAQAGSLQEAADADFAVVAVPWEQLPAVAGAVPSWKDRIVIDAANPVLMPGFRLAELGGHSSSEVVSGLLPGARLVKTFNTLQAAVLASDARQDGGRRVLFYSGDDAAAKTLVAQLLDRMGLAGIDLGTLASGSRLQQFPGGPLPALNLLKLG